MLKSFYNKNCVELYTSPAETWLIYSYHAVICEREIKLLGTQDRNCQQRFMRQCIYTSVSNMCPSCIYPPGNTEVHNTASASWCVHWLFSVKHANYNLVIETAVCHQCAYILAWTVCRLSTMAIKTVNNTVFTVFILFWTEKGCNKACSSCSMFIHMVYQCRVSMIWCVTQHVHENDEILTLRVVPSTRGSTQCAINRLHAHAWSHMMQLLYPYYK